MALHDTPTQGLFISFEGIDGAGKSTHIEGLANAFRAQGRAVTAAFGAPVALRLAPGLKPRASVGSINRWVPHEVSTWP